MNTNGNTYTVIYSTVLVVLVAAILSFVAMSLQDKQNENVKMETISKVLTAAAESDPSVTIDETTNVMQMYADMVTAAFFVDGSGKNVESMELGKEDLNRIEVPTTADLKKQNDEYRKMKNIETKGRNLYVKDFGEEVTDEEFLDYFRQFGEIEGGKIMRDSQEPHLSKKFGEPVS